MSKAKYEFVLEMVDEIEFIVSQSTNLTAALNDRIKKPAILMALMQIGETLNQIDVQSDSLKEAQKDQYIKELRYGSERI